MRAARRQVEETEAGKVTRLRYGQRGRQVEKILRHCGLWQESPARGPPSPGVMIES